MFTIFAGISQFERYLISQRRIEGLNAARARGKKGRHPKTNEKERLSYQLKCIIAKPTAFLKSQKKLASAKLLFTDILITINSSSN